MASCCASSSSASLWRFFYLLGAIAVVGGPGCLISLPLFALGRFVPIVDLWTGRYARWAINLMMKVNRPWLRVDVHDHGPRQALRRGGTPFILVANHRSHLDVFLLISTITNVRIVAKHTLFYIPFLGFMMWVMRQISMRRGSVQTVYQTILKSKAALFRGDVLLVFPEGRRCEANQPGVQAFQPLAFRLAMETKLPIIPLVIAGTDLVWPRGSFALSPGKVSVDMLAPIDPRQFSDVEALTEYVRDTIAKQLEKRA